MARTLIVVASLILPISGLAQTRPIQDRLVPMSGTVVMEDGTPPPEPVRIELVCGGGPSLPSGLTDSKGGFTIRHPKDARSVLGIADARQAAGTRADSEYKLRRGERGLTGDPDPDIVSSDCVVQARLKGYRSSTVNVRADSTAGDLGTIILRPQGKAKAKSVKAAAK